MTRAGSRSKMALAARARGERLPYAQFDASSGEFIGSTSLYEINPVSPREIAIGHTWFGRRWWGDGHNAASKLVLLTYCFETLGAARVAWHTDIQNGRLLRQRSPKARCSEGRGAAQAPVTA